MRWVQDEDERTRARDFVPAELLRVRDWNDVHANELEYRCDFSDSIFRREHMLGMFGDLLRESGERMCFVVALGEEELQSEKVLEITDRDRVPADPVASGVDDFRAIVRESAYFGVFPQSGSWFCVSGLREERAVFCCDQQFQYDSFVSILWPEYVRMMKEIASLTHRST
jgi:hypothetical protein